jgi:hypothetical protein
MYELCFHVVRRIILYFYVLKFQRMVCVTLLFFLCQVFPWWLYVYYLSYIIYVMYFYISF